MMKRFISLLMILIMISPPFVITSYSSSCFEQSLKSEEQNNSKEIQQNHVWPLNMGNPQRTGRSIYDTSQNKGGEKWKIFWDSSIWGSATIDKNGIIYVAVDFRGIYAIYSNGTIKWENDLKEFVPGEMNREYQAPTIAPDGTIYVGTTNYFYAFYPNGTLKWIANVSGNFWDNPVIDSQGTVYASTQEGIIYAIYSNGTTKWKRNIQDVPVGAIALDEDENIYFYGYYNDTLTCLNPDGSVKWVFEEINVYDGPVIGDEGTIYLSGDFLTAISPNGTLKWRFDLFDLNCFGYPSIAPDGTIILSGTTSYSSITPDGKKIFSGSPYEYEYVTALDPSDCSIIWRYTVGKDQDLNSVSHAVIGADGTIFISYTMLSNTLGYVCALSPDGTLKWKTQITSDIYPYTL